MQIELGEPMPEQQDNDPKTQLAAARAILRRRNSASQFDLVWAEKVVMRADPNSKERIIWSV